jgi:hypothetical protein
MATARIFEVILHNAVLTNTSEISWFDSRWGQEMYIFSIIPTEVLDPSQHPIRWVPGDSFLWVEMTGT